VGRPEVPSPLRCAETLRLRRTGPPAWRARVGRVAVFAGSWAGWAADVEAGPSTTAIQSRRSGQAHRPPKLVGPTRRGWCTCDMQLSSPHASAGRRPGCALTPDCGPTLSRARARVFVRLCGGPPWLRSLVEGLDVASVGRRGRSSQGADGTRRGSSFCSFG